MTLGIDDTCDIVHGHQQLSLFNERCDERCFLPIHVYDTERSRPVAMVRRPGEASQRLRLAKQVGVASGGKTPSGVEVRACLHRLVHPRRLKTRILVRDAGHYAKPEAGASCDSNGL